MQMDRWKKFSWKTREEETSETRQQIQDHVSHKEGKILKSLYCKSQIIVLALLPCF